MSHFMVMVVGGDIEAQLAPFQENNMGDCPKEYLQFVDREDELREEFESGSKEMIVMADGSLVSPYDQRFKVTIVVKSPSPFGNDYEYKYPAASSKREVPYRDLYATFDEYVKAEDGTTRDEETKRYGYWENPNKKWDWFQLGGRWTGFFKLKASVGVKGVLGKLGIFPKRPTTGTADQALKCNIDFEGMRNAAAEKASAEWIKGNGIINGREIKSFEECKRLVMANPDEPGAEDDPSSGIETARKMYWAQPALADLRKCKDFYPFDDPLRFCIPREQYVQQARDQACVTFALLNKGKWYERGQMGWWGIVSNEKGRDEWNIQFARMLDELPENTLLSVVDCHI